jgi:ParB family chromosome partitioning protein
MIITVTEPEVLAEDTSPAETPTPVVTAEADEQWIGELDLPQVGYIEVPIDSLIVHPGNVRKNLNLTPEFVRSIKAEGVIEPVEITPAMPATPDRPATYHLIDGHRRLAGSKKAKRATIPCFFKIARGDDVAGQFLDMVITSRHKEKLTAQEEANALFAAFEAGASKTRLTGAYGKAKEVDAALKAATLSEETQVAAAKAAAAIEYPWTVDELAGLAEFSDDAEATARLIKAYEEDQFAWTLESEREERKEAQAREKIREDMKAAGVRLYEADEVPAGLVRLLNMPTAGGRGIEPDAHAECPGHVAVFTHASPPSVYYACADSENCPHINRETFTPPVVATPPSGAEQVAEAARKQAEAKAQRARVLQGNKDWRAARTVRQKWLAALVTRTSLSREETDAITRWTAENYLRMSWVVSSGISGYVGQTDLRAELLGVKNPNWSELTAKASAKRLLLLTFLPLVAAYEKNMHDQQWRTDNRHDYRAERKQAAAWLTFLMSLGYKVSPIEKAVLEGVEYNPGVPVPAAPDALDEDDVDEVDPQDEPEDDTEAQDGPEADQSDPQGGPSSDQDDPDPRPEDADED